MAENKPRKRPDRDIQVEPGDNAKYLNHSLTMMKWDKPNMDSAEEVEQRVYDYFSLCAQNDMKPTFAGMALAFRVDRNTLWRWCNNHPESRKLTEDVRDTLKMGYRILNAQMEDYMANFKIHPTAGIFMMKNNMGYKDESEVVLKPETPLGDQASPEDLQKKYLEDAYGTAQIVETE